MVFPYPEKEVKLIFNHIENTCENLYKTFSNEARKASAENLLNPKKMDLDLVNMQVDLNTDLDKLKELDPNFFNEIKGCIHSFETSAQHLLRAYKNKPEEKSGSMQFEYFKELQNAEEELKAVLNKIFQTIKGLNF